MTDATPPSSAPDAAAAVPRSPRRRWGRRLLLAGLLATAALGGAGTWAWHSEAGARWALQQVPGLSVEGWHGALGDADLGADRLAWQQGQDRLEIRGLRLNGLAWRWRPAPGLWLGLDIDRLQADTVRWHSGPSSGPTTAPTSLRLPAALQVTALRVAQLAVDDLPTVQGLQARLQVSEGGGARHRLSALQGQTDRFTFNGEASLGTDAPLPLQAELRAQSLPGHAAVDWQARLSLTGPLAELSADAELQGQRPVATPQVDAKAQPIQRQATQSTAPAAPKAQVHTRLRLFEPWPVDTLSLQADDLDLGSLHSGAPRTRLQVRAALQSAGLDQPAVAQLALTNALPGRWDQGQLPLRSLQLRASGTPQPLRQVTLEQLDLVWGDAQATAGRWTGQGHWQLADDARSAQSALNLQLADWQPGSLGLGLPAVVLSGPVQWQGQGLPGTAAAAPSAASAVAPGPAPGAPSVPALLMKLTARLQGNLGAAPASKANVGPAPKVQLVLDAEGGSDRLLLRELSLSAEGARARLAATVQRQGSGRDAAWQAQAQGELRELDPRPWWPALARDSRGAHRLNATLDAQLSLAQAAAAQALDHPAQAWAAWRGQLALKLLPSQWADVPLQGSFNLSQGAPASTDGGGPQGRLQLQLDDGSVQGDWRAEGGSLRLDLPRLAALAPWAQVLGAGPWAPKAGRLQAEAQVSRGTAAEGWAWRTEAHLLGLEAGGIGLKDSHLWGHGGLSADAPLQLALAAGPLQRGDARWQQLAASVEGSLRDHRFALQLDSPLLAPVWLERLSGARPNSGTQLRLQGDGHWDGKLDAASATVTPGAWTLRLAELRLGAGDGSGQAWLGAQGVQARLDWDDAGALTSVQLAPGSLQLPGTALQWREARHQAAAAGQAAQTVLDAQFQATEVAPLLARMQPDMGWAGDLRLGGVLQVRHAGQLGAELRVERLGGDLSIEDDGQPASRRRQTLGLSALSLSVGVRQGQWQVQQVLRGTYTGSLQSELTAQTDPARWVPDAAAPLKGRVDLNVANLGTWAPWLPPGWRLGGQLQSQARLAGRWGAPELAGELSGQNLSVRNPLQGVELQDGQLRVSLDGPKARVEQFQFRGGDGRLDLSGEAQLGEAPRLRLTAEAQRFRALSRIDRRLVTSGQAVLVLDRDSLSLTGQLQVDEGLFDISRGDGPSLAEDVVIAEPEGSMPSSSAAAGSRSPKRSNMLALQIDLGKQLRLKGHGIDTGLQGTLKLSNPRGKIAGQGTISTAGGNYAAYGQKLSIERGQILFNGPLDDPRLDIYAIRPNLDTKVGVLITGTALNPRVRLASDTEMTDTEKLSWLVMGRAPDTLGQADTALLQRAALALLAGDGQGPTDRLMESIGLSDFSVRQSGEGSAQTTVVSVGKQLTRRWYVGYERSINATTGTWQLIYRIAQRFTLRAQSGEDSALDLIWTWRWE